MLQSTGHTFFGNAANVSFLNEAFRKENLSQAKWKSKYEQALPEFRSPKSDAARTQQAQRKYVTSIGAEPQAAPIGFGASEYSNPLEQTIYGRKKLVDTQFFDESGIPLFHTGVSKVKLPPLRPETPITVSEVDDEEAAAALSLYSPSARSSEDEASLSDASPSSVRSRALSPLKSRRSRRSNSPSKRSRASHRSTSSRQSHLVVPGEGLSRCSSRLSRSSSPSKSRRCRQSASRSSTRSVSPRKSRR